MEVLQAMTMLATGPQDIPARDIVAGNNDRKFFKDSALQGLAESIATDGLLQRPVVRPLPSGQYQIVAGERRTRAMRDILQWDMIPVDVQLLDDDAAAAFMLLENTARVDLDPIEEARAYHVRMDSLGWDLDRVAKTAGKTTGHIERRLQLLQLPSDIQDLVARGIFKASFAALLCGLDVNRQRFALHVWQAKPEMNLSYWRRVVAEYRESQANESQLNFLELAAMTESIKERPTATKGKSAPTGGWYADCAPPMQLRAKARSKDNMAFALMRYAESLRSLEQDGAFISASDAVMQIYNTFVCKGYLQVTPDIEVSAGDPTAQELAQFEYIEG